MNSQGDGSTDVVAIEELQVGAFYLDERTGWRGQCVALLDYAPRRGTKYLQNAGTGDERAVFPVGPDPVDQTLWVVQVDDGLEKVPIAELNIPLVRVTLQGVGPKGAVEDRNSLPADLSPIDASEVLTDG